MKLLQMPTDKEALPGRNVPMAISSPHSVLNVPIVPPFPDRTQKAMFGMGCFWGAEKKFWQKEGVYVTAVGYSAGITPNPLYEEVCCGLTGHNEVVLVVFDPSIISYGTLLKIFWQGHNPTLGMRQGNDIGTQYRSGIYCFSKEQLELAQKSLYEYQKVLDISGCNRITTEVMEAPVFYYAEQYHQQYLDKNPDGYCPDITCYATGLPTFPS